MDDMERPHERCPGEDPLLRDRAMLPICISRRFSTPNRVALLFCIIALFCLRHVTAQSIPQRPLAFVGGTVYASPRTAPISDAVVVIMGGKITAVGSRRSVPIPPDATVIRCDGFFITSAFQNSHVHFSEEK
jgi:hypothetical protein